MDESPKNLKLDHINLELVYKTNIKKSQNFEKFCDTGITKFSVFSKFLNLVENCFYRKV